MLIPLDDVVHFDCTTHHPGTGAVADADATPTFSVFEEDTDTPILSAQNFTKRTALTGDYRGSFAASAANGLEAGKWYNVIASATVNSIAAKYRALVFRVVLAESVAGVPKSDVSHLGGVAQSLTDLKDFADDGYDPGTNKVQGVVLTDSVTTYTGNTPQTGDVFPLASTEIADIKAKTDNLPTDPADQSLVIAATDAIMTRLGAPAGASVSADLAAIEAQTDDIGAAGAGLTALATAVALATVQADTDDIQARLPVALVDGRLDVSVGALAANVMTAAAAAADLTTELQAGLATAVWAATTRVLTAATNITSTGGTTVPQTGDSYARLGAPVGASLSVDLAAVKAESAGIKAKTDNLPTDPADQSLIIAATDAVMSRLGVAGAGLTDLGGMSTTMKAQVESEMTDALNAILADSVPADGTIPTLRQAVYMIWQFLAERSVSGTTLTVRKADGSTALMTFTLSDAVSPQSVTRAT